MAKYLDPKADIKEAVDLSETVAFNDSELNAYNDYWDVVRREKTLLKKKKARGACRGREKSKIRNSEKVIIGKHAT